MSESSKQQAGKAITLAVTGASGAPYALRLLEQLSHHYDTVYLMLSSAARVVFATEVGVQVSKAPSVIEKELTGHLGIAEGKIKAFASDNWMSPVASGSSAPKQMIICPCSTGTLSAIAHGASDNLIERAADVVLKERGQLLLVPREMPYNTIHLQNMTKLSEMGVTIMPASPGFYNEPKTIDDLVDFVVARILDHLDIDHTLGHRWGYSGN
ncbi:aromatic acid decarboxylase [Kangiella profundi]|uniref:Flavin prenyltransferase UbiX n=1 Tax=Kangiella profundi TaxID=1561924 RepID=A0A2K9AWD8_9GAMM|nr:flavin prenyltransferase UbiX [Kangiella profundi]AUD78209.1 aromatic acid decarboxylase [Kangiella profundi]GGF06071.1 flavin prenyltransferase UbiX [Kangiella profundi]